MSDKWVLILRIVMFTLGACGMVLFGWSITVMRGRLAGVMVPSVPSVPESGAWSQNTNARSGKEEWTLVDLDGRVRACVNTFHSEMVWSVWLNGAGRGEFITRDLAMREAERVAGIVTCKPETSREGR